MNGTITPAAGTIAGTAEGFTASTVPVGFTVVMPCGGDFRVTSAEVGPEAGEVSLFSGTERFIFSADQAVSVATW